MPSTQNLRSSLRALVGAAAALLALAATPAAAQVIQFADGTNPSPTPACPGGGLVPVNGFTLAFTGSGTTAVGGVRMTFSPLGAWQLVDKIEIRNGATVLGSLVPTSDYAVVQFTPYLFLGNAPVALTAYVQIKGQADMPPPGAGSSASVALTVDSVWSGWNSQGADVSASIPINNSTPANVVWNTVTPGATNVAATWKGAAQTVLVLRQVGGPVTDVPVEGASYPTAGGLLVKDTIVATGSMTGFNDTTAKAGKANFYKVFVRDACGNWSTGVALGPIYPGGVAEGAASGNGPVVGILNPVAGTVTPPFKVQARVFSPSGAITNVVVEADDGVAASPISVTLNRNNNYGTAPDSGIFEAALTTPTLTAGKYYTLRVKATNGAGTVPSNAVGVQVSAGKGDGHLLRRDNSSQLCDDCHGGTLKTHSSEATGTKYGSWYVGCRGCHTPHSTTNAALIANEITPPAVNGQWPPAKTVFSTRTGFDPAAGVTNSATMAAGTYANGDRTGPCQVCHTRTDHYRRNGEPVSHFSTQCTQCHSHTGGFAVTGGCTSCHGDSTRTDFATHAPPKDTCGNTTGGNVGAHVKHLSPTLGTFSDGVTCAQCHTDPPGGAHPRGPSCSANQADRAVMTWGAVATGSVNAWSGTVSPSYVYGTQTCSNTYCHGAFKQQPGQLPPYTSSVTWNSTVACGGCHATPPGGTHSSNTNCAGCHGAGYSQTAVTGAAKLTHVNGVLEVTGGTSCYDCHGDGARALVAGVETTLERYKAAPPALTPIPGVTNPPTQAHLQHVYTTTTVAQLTCDKCHPLTTSLGHSDGVLDLPFTGLARTGGVTPIYSGSPAFTCATVYCHGGAFPANAQGSGTLPAWTSTNGSFKACGSCHGSPPANPKHLSLTSRSITATAACNSCHSPTVDVGGAIIIAGGKHVDGVYDTANVTCTSCHGTPPISTATLADFNNANGVGGHPQHAVAPLQTRTNAFACTTCHPNNTTMTHATGTPDMTFAASFAVSTVWRNATSDCTTSYCHGDTNTVVPVWKAGAPVGGLNAVAQGTWGGNAKQPVWTNVSGTYRACSACHGAPPALSATNPHPTNTACASCHGAGYTQTGVAGTAKNTHVDGHVDLTHTGCSACHGDLTADSVAFTDTRAMPGFNAAAADVAGFLTTTAAGVGAHMKHLTGTTFKTLNGGKGAVCVDCHVVPATGDIAHAKGTSSIAGQLSRATVTFNNVAMTGLASGGTPLASTYTNSTTAAGGTASGTCNSVYCHGGKWDADVSGHKGTNVRPKFTDGAMNCGSCHQSPPSNSSHIGVVSATAPKNCVQCHGGTYSCSITAPGNYTSCAVDLTLHINGTADVVGMTCTTCHGQPPVSLATLADPANNPTGIGAHDPHVNHSTLRASVVGCAACHQSPLPTDTSHVNGVIDLAWVGLASSGITATPASVTPAWLVTPTCTNYCHTPGSAAIFGGSNRAPSWMGGPSQAACGTCHGAPPPVTAAAGVDHPQNTNCSVCHGAGFATTGITGTARNTHLNGSTVSGVDKPANGCTACHGVLAGVSGAVAANVDPGVAPGYVSTTTGVDTTGASAVSAPKVGAHDAHVRPAGSLNATAPIACATCHGALPPVGDTAHANGAIAASWAQLVSSTGIVVAPAPVAGAFPAGWESTPNCTNYCHSNASPVGRTASTASPSWTSPANLTCTSCHEITSTIALNTSLSLGHRLHITTAAGGGYFYNCSQCHNTTATGQSDGTGLAITTPANHVSGTHTVAFNAAFNPGATSYSQGPSYACNNTYCHSNGTDNASPPANTSIAWTATKTCSSCHGFNAADPVVIGSTGGIQKGGSAKHLNHVANAALIGANYKCGDCHKNTISAGTDATMVGTTFHVNRAKDVSIANRGSKTSSDTTTTCASTWCHSSGQTNLAAPNYEPVGWTSTWVGSTCNKCHGAYTAADGASYGFVSVAGEPNYTNGGQGTTTANSHQKHVPSYACNVCHFGSVNAAGTAIVGTSHTDGAVQMALSTTVAGAGATYTPGSGVAGSCSASKCHGSGTPQWGGPAQKCSDCHTGVTDTDSFAFGTPGVGSPGTELEFAL